MTSKQVQTNFLWMGKATETFEGDNIDFGEVKLID